MRTILSVARRAGRVVYPPACLSCLLTPFISFNRCSIQNVPVRHRVHLGSDLNKLFARTLRDVQATMSFHLVIKKMALAYYPLSMGWLI